MNPREKVLATIVVAVLVLGGLWATVRWGVTARWNDLDRKITQVKRQKRELEKKLAGARTAEQRWQDLQPISHNPDRAAERFQQDISALVGRHVPLETLSVRAPRKLELKSGFSEVRLSFQFRGTLQQVVNLLCDYYCREYLTRLDQITLTAEEGHSSARTVLSTRGGSRRARSPSPARNEPAYGPEGPELNVSILASALVLPEGKGLPPQPVTTQVAGGGPQSCSSLPRARDEYAAIWDTNIFKLYQKPRQVAVQPPEGETKPLTSSRPVAPLAPRRPNKVLKGVNSLNGKLVASVYDEDRRELPPERVGINDEVDDGTLVLVVPQGMVVQVEELQKGSFVFTYYFYPLGTSFRDRVELDPKEYPEIAEQLELALVP